MRYAVLTDIHANLEALEAVLAKIDEVAKQELVDEIWFLGDLVGYGPDPNECIRRLRERTNVIIAGNHDWAAVDKIDLEDFSEAARISAEWTAEQLTPEHREFLANLPQRLDMGEVTLVHGSPFGPLWEYLTSEVLAERSFQYYTSRYCFVGHTHVPVIFQQPDPIANMPTTPLTDTEQNVLSPSQVNGVEDSTQAEDDESEEMVQVHSLMPPEAMQTAQAAQVAQHAASAYKDPESGRTVTEEEANAILESHFHAPTESETGEDITVDEAGAEVEEDEASSEENQRDKAAFDDTSDVKDESVHTEEAILTEEDVHTPQEAVVTQVDVNAPQEAVATEEELHIPEDDAVDTDRIREEESQQGQESAEEIEETDANGYKKDDRQEQDDEALSETNSLSEERLNSEIEELLTLLGLSQSMVQVTNEMIVPPEGHWEAPQGYRAIINPGGVGQPRDGDPRAAFMIYDTERGFEFYRIPYAIEKTQEKIIKAGLPRYLAVRLAYGR